MSEETNPILEGIWPARVVKYGITLTNAKLAQATIEVSQRVHVAAQAMKGEQ